MLKPEHFGLGARILCTAEFLLLAAHTGLCPLQISLTASRRIAVIHRQDRGRFFSAILLANGCKAAICPPDTGHDYRKCEANLLRGGVADKLGNDYEALWVAQQFLSVYIGSAQSVTYEPISEQGFELFIEFPDRTEWHQCKVRTASGQWTINQLANAGVLAAFAAKLSNTENVCVFVSDTDAQSFRAISGKARIAGGYADFTAAVSQSKENQVDFENLAGLWGVDGERAFDWLKRCRVESVSPNFIARNLQQTDTLLFCERVTRYDQLHRYVADRLTRRVTTEDIRTELAEYGLTPRPNATDPTVRQSLEAVAERFVINDASRRPKILVDRSSIISAAVEWYESPSERYLFLSGEAGAGKSVVVADLSKQLRQRGVTVLPFRLDQFLSLSRPRELGLELLDIACDPASALCEPNPTTRPVLIIDQLDAVSDASGRRRTAKELVFKLIQSIDQLASAKVVLVCRAYDLNNDSQLKQLSDRPFTTKLPVPPMDWSVTGPH